MVSTKNFKYKKWAENQPTPTLDKEPIFTNHDTNIFHNSTNFQLYVQYSNYNFPNSNFHLRKYHPAYPHSL